MIMKKSDKFGEFLEYLENEGILPHFRRDNVVRWLANGNITHQATLDANKLLLTWVNKKFISMSSGQYTVMVGDNTQNVEYYINGKKMSKHEAIEYVRHAFDDKMKLKILTREEVIGSDKIKEYFEINNVRIHEERIG